MLQRNSNKSLISVENQIIQIELMKPSLGLWNTEIQLLTSQNQSYDLVFYLNSNAINIIYFALRAVLLCSFVLFSEAQQLIPNLLKILRNY